MDEEFSGGSFGERRNKHHAPAQNAGPSESTGSLLRAFSLFLCTGNRGEVRRFWRKSRTWTGCSVCTRSENSLVEEVVILFREVGLGLLYSKRETETGSVPNIDEGVFDHRIRQAIHDVVPSFGLALVGSI